MSVLNVREYQHRQDVMHAKCWALARRMHDLPFNMRHVDLDAEVKLQKTQEWLLDNPPLYEVVDEAGNGTGQFKKRHKGLIHTATHPTRVSNYPKADFKTIPLNEWSDWIGGPDSVNLRPFVPHIMDQNGVGSCASEAASQCIQICRAIGKQDPVKLSPWAVYHTVSGGRDVGSGLPDNVDFVTTYGVPSQEVYPRGKGWRAKPTAEAMEDAKKYRATEVFRISTWEEFGSCLLYGMPVYFGYSGHAITAVSLLSTTQLQYANSWGDWGDEGFGTLSKNSIYWGYGVFGFRAVVRSSSEPSQQKV